MSPSRRVGLRALMEVSGCLDKKRLTTGTVGFGLAPRINAAGRLERAMMAVEMLTTDDTAMAREIAAELDRCNTRRQEIERQIVDEARAMIEAAGRPRRPRRDRAGPARAGTRASSASSPAGWSRSITGPTIVVWLWASARQGSARSIPGFDLYEAIKDCSDGLLGFGGHAAAAGLEARRATTSPTFAAPFEEPLPRLTHPEQLERKC